MNKVQKTILIPPWKYTLVEKSMERHGIGSFNRWLQLALDFYLAVEFPDEYNAIKEGEEKKRELARGND